MNSLRDIAQGVSESKYALPSGRTIPIAAWTVRFQGADPPRLRGTDLKSTYTSKPLVQVDGDSVFGELAIVRWLQKDGWSALWADTFHGRKFWSVMPHCGAPVEPPAPIRALYDRIAQIKGSASGCFDVVAWKDGRVIWLEYKGPGDRPNANEAAWIDAALRAGVEPTDLFFVGAAAR